MAIIAFVAFEKWNLPDCAANGGAKDDHSGLVKALEIMAGHEVK